ncbi:hypothetical protein [Chitinophaga sp. Cy-1792]|uniref:hypothetical protein n=1 Tax=Chitinophaga sp. Cy-1792 TaxID=2608339 RepID=UPI0014216789|nr:hypothetical protein [Chitinophaga sp. Cy-1792]NIG57063.1 hypothetical protein [Chitinophaga sp. Cy-1792]
MKKLISGIFFLVPLLALGQQRALVTVQASCDPNAVPELYNSVPLELKLIYSDSTSENVNSNRKSGRWNKLNVHTSNGQINNGLLTFDRAQLVKDNYTITLEVSPSGEKPVTTTLQLPRLTGMRFNHYADSLKRNIHFYLNVEGKFSTGKILPLDTSAVRFKTSAGKIIGQDLLLDIQDTTKIIQVEAWYKLNPSLYLITNIPVKQIND